ncbi:MAG TPA: YceI family protein [Nocardioides sp.]|nr:YceI family protein [Nocardioides sp.]
MTTTPTWSPTRTVDGVVLPGVGTWAIDPGHADVAFTGRHLMLTKVRGRFQDVRGSITVGETMNDSTVDVTIGMASVESGSSARDEHLRSAELFDVETFPEATFRSVSVEWDGDGGVVDGDLTIHGTTRRVPLRVAFEGYVRDPAGADRAIFSAETQVNREDFGITWNVALEAGGVLVSKDIKITIDIETVLSRPA